MKCTSAPPPDPAPIAPTTSVGSDFPMYIVTIASSSTIPCPTRTSPAARYGEATVITATAIEMRTSGKRGTSLRSKVTENTCARSVRSTNTPDEAADHPRQCAGRARRRAPRRQRCTRISANATSARAQQCHQVVEDEDEGVGVVGQQPEEAGEGALGGARAVAREARAG